MTSLLDRVRFAIERDALVPPGSRVLAAVSGGADSVAMLHLLLSLAPACGFALAGLAHLNHGLRGSESDGDEAFCRDLAGRLGLPIEVVREDVSARAHADRVSIEVAARRARYAFFREAAERLDADRISTGHTRDDQAETFLLRVLRGAGASGLAGISPRRGPIVRPLLDIRHGELVEYLAGLGLAFREDSSNRDVTIPRNWVRHELLPLLAARLNADVIDVLARDAHVLRDEAALIESLSDRAAGTIETTTPNGRIRLDAAGLCSLPLALARRIVRHAAGRIDGAGFIGFDHVEQILAIACNADRATAADLPGVRVERNGADVVLSSRGSRQAPAERGFRVRLPVPGRVTLPQCGCVIDVQERPIGAVQVHQGKDVAVDPTLAVLDAAVAADGLWVRGRQLGDRLRPLGMSGRKKLHDVLVDRKVPRETRDRVPIVVDGHDEIVWVGGHLIDHGARVTEGTQTVVILKLTRLGEP